MRGRPRPDQGARGREGRPLALEAAALQVPAQARARLRREDAHRPQEGQLDPGALVLDRVDKVRGGGRQRRARLLRRRGQAGGGGQGEARGLVEAEARKPRWQQEGRLPAAASRASTPRTAADLVFEAGEFSRFRNARSFAAWVGLTPSEHSSGESDRRARSPRPATST
ncbi:MAG: transposase [Collinsella sp.]